MDAPAATIVYRDTGDIDLFQLAKLLEAAAKHEKTTDLGALSKMVAGSAYLVSAWDGDTLVGFARALSDGVREAYVSAVLAAPGPRQKEVLKGMLERLLAGRDGITFVLAADELLSELCPWLGFAEEKRFFRRLAKGAPR